MGSKWEILNPTTRARQPDQDIGMGREQKTKGTKKMVYFNLKIVQCITSGRFNAKTPSRITPRKQFYALKGYVIFVPPYTEQHISRLLQLLTFTYIWRFRNRKKKRCYHWCEILLFEKSIAEIISIRQANRQYNNKKDITSIVLWCQLNSVNLC